MPTIPLRPAKAPANLADTTSPPLAAAPSSSRTHWLWPALIVAAIAAAYANALSGPPVLDDPVIIALNPTIRHLGLQALRPFGAGSPVQGRPLFNLTLALNYALGGQAMRGYHLLNVSLHAINALLLFGVVRRTLAVTAAAAATPQPRHGLLALVVALLWGLHPLGTAAVDYVSQRSEILVSGCYLLALYAVVRAHSAESLRPRSQRLWHAAALLACVAGMASKEVMASAPLVILLYDRIFLSRSWKQCFQRRGLLYGGMAASWLLLAALVTASGTREHTAGFGGPLGPWQYALTQCQALATYLKLSFWPGPLVFDYGNDVARGAYQVWPQALLLLALLLAIALSFRWMPWLGFLGVAWFAVLAPSSSFVPVWTQTIAEHRAYLPLAALLTAAVLAADGLALRLSARLRSRSSRRPRHRAIGVALTVLAVAPLAAALGYGTHRRNRDYRTDVTLLEDTVRKRPSNVRALNTLGVIYLSAGRIDQALDRFNDALRLDPGFALSYSNRGNALVTRQQYARAIEDYSAAIRLKPDFAAAYFNRGNACASEHRYDEAISDYTRALKLQPDLLDAYLCRANLYNNFAGRFSAEAIADCDAALTIDPHCVSALNARGNALVLSGRHEQAVADYSRAIALDPSLPHSFYNRGNAYGNLHRYDDAIADYTRAIQLSPDFAVAYNNRGIAYAFLHNARQAIADYTQALQLKPTYVEAHVNRLLVHMDLHDYDAAWADVAQLRKLGIEPNPQLVRRLTDASGRSQ
jgi:tetratricopeptide (TPR) repeat protein